MKTSLNKFCDAYCKWLDGYDEILSSALDKYSAEAELYFERQKKMLDDIKATLFKRDNQK